MAQSTINILDRYYVIFLIPSHQPILFTGNIRDITVTGFVLLTSSEALYRSETGEGKHKHDKNDDEEDDKQEDTVLVHRLT